MYHEHGNCYSHRQFLTKEEKIEHLKHYKNWLEQEAKGVEEAIDKLKTTKT